MPNNPRVVVYSFQFPQRYSQGPISTLADNAYRFFRFKFDPGVPPMALEEMTVADLAGWIWSTVQELRARKALPFEWGHLREAAAALRQSGILVPEDPSENVPLRRLLPPRALRAAWDRSAARLGMPLSKPSTSVAGWLLSVFLATGPYIAFLKWFDQWAGPVEPVLKDALGWTFFACALALAMGIAWLLSPLFPGAQLPCEDTSQLAASLSRQKPRPTNALDVWTESIIADKTRALVAAAFNIDRSRVQSSTRLADLLA
jgi:hypothetical protein